MKLKRGAADSNVKSDTVSAAVASEALVGGSLSDAAGLERRRLGINTVKSSGEFRESFGRVVTVTRNSHYY